MLAFYKKALFVIYEHNKVGLKRCWNHWSCRITIVVACNRCSPPCTTVSSLILQNSKVQKAFHTNLLVSLRVCYEILWGCEWCRSHWSTVISASTKGKLNTNNKCNKSTHLCHINSANLINYIMEFKILIMEWPFIASNYCWYVGL